MVQDLPSDTEHLAALLEDAARTLACLRVSRVRPCEYRGYWPDTVLDAAEAYGWAEEDLPLPVPSARAISDMDRAFRWIALIPLDPARAGAADRWSVHGGAQLRRLVIARAQTNPRTGRPRYGWRRLGRSMGCSHEAARAWHAQALGRILASLHRARAAATPAPIRLPAFEPPLPAEPPALAA